MRAAGPKSSVPECIKPRIAAIWMRNQGRVFAQLDLLDRAAAAVSSGTSEPDLLEEAEVTAHKLAGSLGMFGFEEGTLVARALEQSYNAPHHDGVMLSRRTSHLREILMAGPV